MFLEKPLEASDTLSLTVGFEAGRLTVAASCLVNSLDEKDISGPTLQAVHCVVVLLDVRYDHPAVCRVVQTWQSHRHTHTDRHTKHYYHGSVDAFREYAETVSLGENPFFIEKAKNIFPKIQLEQSVIFLLEISSESSHAKRLGDQMGS